MTQNERVKEVRKTLGLTLEKFGERIGVTRGSMSNIENGNRNLTEQMTKSICREFSVDYIWLTTGDGEMFVDTDDDFIERIDRIMVGEDDARKNLFKALLEASDEDIAAFQRIIDLFASKKTDSLSTASLMGVEIQHEFVYPLEDAFVLYLSDYFDNSLFVIQGRHHPLSELHCIIYFHDCGNIEVDFHNHGNRSSCCRNPAALWYNYLYSDSNRSVMFTPNAIAIISS